MRDGRGRVIYVGKATSIRRRVASYWRKQEWTSRPQVKDLIREVRTISYERTPTAIEALILEANLIKKYEPKYNIIQKDDKSFLYLAITRDPYPKPLLIRGHELSKVGERHYRAVFGPYTSPSALRAALKIIRRAIPWSTCGPGAKRSCFDYHIRACPGVCVGAISKADYTKVIRNLILFFQGKKSQIIRGMRVDMKRMSASERYEEAEELRWRISALEHIQDVAVLTRESPLFGKPTTEELTVNIFGRIEGYDISNISGTAAVGSMVVFADGDPKKSEYRKFRIKTVKGADDYAMIAEVLRRRFSTRRYTPRSNNKEIILRAERSGVEKPASSKVEKWPLPDLIMIDGGWGQVNVTKKVLAEAHLDIPIVGIAKGFDRKQDRLIYEQNNLELGRIVEQYKEILQRLRDEAHRFAVSYHRKLRGKLQKFH